VALPLNILPEASKVKNTFKQVNQTNMMYDFNKWEEEWEIKQYMQFLKKHYKLYKQLHFNYT